MLAIAIVCLEGRELSEKGSPSLLLEWLRIESKIGQYADLGDAQ